MMYRSPGGSPAVPALPRPGTRTREPVCTPAGILISIVSTRRTRPSPPHTRQMFRVRPVPPQCVHVRLKRIFPLVCVTCPEPPHAVQVCGCPTVPVPRHSVQVSRREIVSFFTVPRTASQKLISIWYSRLEPGSACEGASAVAPPPRKNWLNRSRKLGPAPAPPPPPPKSNPLKSK